MGKHAACGNSVTKMASSVHRFLIDPFDAEQLGLAYQTIREQSGTVTDDVEQQYLGHSLGSQALLAALEQRRGEWEAIITGPYLFKLIYDVAQQLADKVLLAPCFHDEPLARLRCFRKVYRDVAGLLFHTEAEARYAAEHLGISHPRHIIVGTVAFRSGTPTFATTTVRTLSRLLWTVLP
jgi:hypothetical protein